MILLVLAAAIGWGLAIRPALAHDNELPVSVTGKAVK